MSAVGKQYFSWIGHKSKTIVCNVIELGHWASAQEAGYFVIQCI